MREHFPIFDSQKSMVYLDSAATTQKPSCVIERLRSFYTEENANIHRGLYGLSRNATENFDNVRSIVANFIGARFEEVIFSSGATDALNMLSYCLHDLIAEGKDEIVLSAMEHHANLIPWQQMAKRHGMKLRFIELNENLTLNMDDARSKIGGKTAIVSTVHVSNALGIKNPVGEICLLAKEQGALSIVDACQSIAHEKINVHTLGCDFLVFSGHKIYGPTGIGVLYGKMDLLKKMEPFRTGGEMITSVNRDGAEWSKTPYKFEAGTPHIAGAIGLGDAISFIQTIGIDKIASHEKDLTTYLLGELERISFVTIHHPGAAFGQGIVSLSVNDVHIHDAATLLAEKGICVRAGHHCCSPLMDSMGIEGTLRVSLAMYNNKKDIDSFITELKDVYEVFHEA